MVSDVKARDLLSDLAPERSKLWCPPQKTVVSSGDPLLRCRSEVVANRPPKNTLFPRSEAIF